MLKVEFKIGTDAKNALNVVVNDIEKKYKNKIVKIKVSDNSVKFSVEGIFTTVIKFEDTKHEGTKVLLYCWDIRSLEEVSKLIIFNFQLEQMFTEEEKMFLEW